MRNPVAISGINFFFCRLMGIAPAVVPRENCPGIGWSIKDEQGVVSGVGQHSFEWVISSPFPKQKHAKSVPVPYC